MAKGDGTSSGGPLSDLVVIFDLDGTLVDSGPDLTEAMNAILAEEGLATLPEAQVRHLVGEGGRALLSRGFAAGGRAFPEGEAGDALVRRFVEHYRGHIADRSRPFPGAEACLERLAGAGAALAICTNKWESLTEPLLEALGLRRHFAEVLSRDSLERYKPDPAPLLEILRRTGRRRGAMIGDTMTDAGAARAAGMPLMLATFGYGEADIVLHAGEQRFDRFDELFDRLLNLTQ